MIVSIFEVKYVSKKNADRGRFRELVKFHLLRVVGVNVAAAIDACAKLGVSLPQIVEIRNTEKTVSIPNSSADIDTDTDDDYFSRLSME